MGFNDNDDKRITTRSFDMYETIKSPQETESTDLDDYPDALQPGGRVPFLSKEGIAIIFQFAAVGTIFGAIPQLLLPFFAYYLNFEGTTAVSIVALLNLPWSLKFVFGIVSDNVPILGYRRKPYLIFGWILCAVSLLVIACRKGPKPYFPDPSWRSIKPMDYTPYIKEHINVDAQKQGGFYVVFLMLATMGYVISDSVADALVVEYSHREPHAVRGQMQAGVFIARNLFMTLGQILVGFLLDTPEYGGDMRIGLTIAQTALVLAIFAVCAMVISWYNIYEEVFYVTEYAQCFHDFCKTIQTRVFYQPVLFFFISGILTAIHSTAWAPILVYWIKITPRFYSVASMISNVVFAATVAFVGRYWLSFSWKKSYVIYLCAIIMFEAMYAFPIAFDINRNKYYVCGLLIIMNVPLAAFYLMECVVALEIAEHGNEATTINLIHTIQNCGSPIAASITKAIDQRFRTWNVDIMNDTPGVRHDVALTMMICLLFQLSSLAFVGLLPNQKYDVHRLRKTGGSSKLLGLVTIIIVSLGVGWAIMTNLMSIFEGTRCLAIAGGCKS